MVHDFFKVRVYVTASEVQSLAWSVQNLPIFNAICIASLRDVLSCVGCIHSTCSMKQVGVKSRFHINCPVSDPEVPNILNYYEMAVLL